MLVFFCMDGAGGVDDFTSGGEGREGVNEEFELEGLEGGEAGCEGLGIEF